MILQTQIHLVQISPWPITIRISLLSLALSTIYWFNYSSTRLLVLPIIATISIAIVWWRDVIRESHVQGLHNSFVQAGLSWGIIIFISTEVIFFRRFFWIFLHIGLIPTHPIGSIWPRAGIYYINPFSVPLLNTGILLLSGVSITWAHHALIKNNKRNLLKGIFIGVALGLLFTYLQWLEYNDTRFDLTDSATGSAIFVATGFHGAHVLIGSIFLTSIWFRGLTDQFSIDHFIGFEIAAWYWHFVDVVWLYLFVCIYWWIDT